MAGLFLHAQGARGLVADPHAAATAQFTALGFVLARIVKAGVDTDTTPTTKG